MKLRNPIELNHNHNEIRACLTNVAQSNNNNYFSIKEPK